MVRETRHLWVGNLPDNIREDRIREHFKRYGRVQNVKLLARAESASVGATGASGVCATVAFMDIKSASKAHNAEHVLDERTLTTEYYEPAAIPATAGAPSAGSSPAGSGYSGSSSSVNSVPAPSSASRYHLSGGEDSSGATTCPIAASAAAPATWRGTNDSATEYCRRGNTPAAYGRYQRNNSTAPFSTPPSNIERTTPHHRWYASGERAGGESTPSTPGGGTESGRRRRLSGSASSRSDSSSPEPSDTSRASTPLAQTPLSHHNRTPSALSHQWASTANGRPLSICVRNLPTRSTDSSLKDGLYHEYKKHGKVVWVKVVGQNADRYAVVRFKKPSDVEKALEVSQDKLFFGCKISVAPHQNCDDDADSTKPYETDIDEYHPKATRTLFIGNLEKDVTQQQLRDKFKHFGRIIEIDIKKGSGGGAGYAFCQYASISSVVEAIRAMDGEYVGGSRVKLGFGKPVATACVWVDGLTEHTEKQVLGAVSRCGAATSVCVDRAAAAALVHFEQAAAAGAAVRELRRVAAAASAAEPDHPRLCVDYASRECQDAFYEQLEKHGGSAALAGSERLSGDITTRYVPSTRHDSIRFEGCGSRSRASSYGRSSSRTPRYTALELFDPDDYAADRRYRVYDETGTSPPLEETPFEDRLQSVVVSPHRARRHRRDSSPEDRKHSKERLRIAGIGPRRSRSGSAGRERHTARRKHRRRHEGSGSRAGTPLRDEPDAPPAEPRRPPRDRPPLPMCLPLPKFAAQLLRAAPPTPRPAPQPAPAPDSPPRPPSVSSSSGGSAPHSPSLEERIKSLDEKYEKWSGSRAIADAPDRARLRHRLLEVDINEVKPSEVVSALLAKRSVFDEDSERLESVVRAPSPPEGRARGASSRLPRYPPLPAHPLPPLTGLSALHHPPLELDALDRPSDPRLNRPERPCRLEKLGKINESDYGECRPRPRTPSTDRSQSEPCDHRSPSASVDVDAESRSRDSATGTCDAESKSSFDMDDKESLENGIKRERSNSSTSDSLLTGKSECISTIPLVQNYNDQIEENKRSDSAQLFNSDQKCAQEVVDVILKKVENDLKLEPQLEKSCKVIDDKQFELCKEGEPNCLLDSESKIAICENTKKSEKIRIDMFNHSVTNKDSVDYEIQSHHINSSNHPKSLKEKDIPEANKFSDKIDKDRFNHNISQVYQIVKLEKENIQLEKHDIEKPNINLPADKKMSEMDKSSEDRVVRSDRDKVKHNKERLVKEKHESEKDRCKNNRTDKCFEKSEKDRKPKEDGNVEKSHAEKIKIEKDTDKHNKDKAESDKLKHTDEKSRHDHHKKDRSEKDRKKENDVESVYGKSKKDDKHKTEKQKKDDVKKEIKKETEAIKSRKSSRDESVREIYRKDSTDSSTSRASHESSKSKELDNHDTKEVLKPRVKLTDLFYKLETDKESFNTRDGKLECSVKIKSEIKEEKIATSASKLDDVMSESNLKPKAEVIEKHRHHSLDSPSTDSKRKERLNSCPSLPSNIGHKRRISSHDTFDSLCDEAKKNKNEPKLPERRDSKDSRSLDKHKTAKFNKCHFAKIIESKTKDDKKVQVKTPGESFIDVKGIKKPAKEENIEIVARIDHTEEAHNNLDFLALFELRSSEEDERQKILRKEMKEKKRIQQLQQIQELQMQQDAMQQGELLGKLKDERKQKTEDKKKDAAREKRFSVDRKSREDKNDNGKKKFRKHAQSSDTTDSDEPKKHSIFDIIDDGPTYISMYDKVKARSCKNMQKQEEEKRQEKIKAKFSQLKQSRAKREEKKRSSWDEDSDSESEVRRKPQKSSLDNSSDEERNHCKKPDDTSNIEFDENKTEDYFSATNDEDMRNKLARKNSRTRIISDSSDDDTSKSKSPNYVNEAKKFDMAIENLATNKFDNAKKFNDHVKRNSLLNLFGKSDSDDSKLKSNNENDNSYKVSSFKSICNDLSSESESATSNRNSGEFRRKHKKKSKKHKATYSDDDSKIDHSDSGVPDGESRPKISEKQRRHSTKKDRRKEKNRDSIDTDDGRDDKLKSKRDKKSPDHIGYEFGTDIVSNNTKRDGKMEDIFGPLSDVSDNDTIEPLNKSDIFCSDFDSLKDRMNNAESKLKDKDDIRRKKEKRRREKRWFREDDNSLDMDAVSKAIEARLCAESLTDEDNRIRMGAQDELIKESDDKYMDSNIIKEIGTLNNKHDKLRRDSREKKKKKKRNKEDRQNRKEQNSGYHHLESFDMSDTEMTEIPILETMTIDSMLLDIPLPNDSQTINEKTDDAKLVTESPSLPRLTESPPVLMQSIHDIDTKSGASSNILANDNNIYLENKTVEIEHIPMPPPFENIVQDISEVPLPADPEPINLNETKTDNFVATLSSDSDLSEDAVSSIPMETKIDKLEIDETVAEKPVERVDFPPSKVEKKVEEKPRAIISQEETEDAVAALLGESFGGKINQFSNYEEPENNTENSNEIENTSQNTENIPEEDAEEMRQAVQNLNACEMELKPDTPVSDSDLLLIDTDTEEADETPQDSSERQSVNVATNATSLNNPERTKTSEEPHIQVSHSKLPIEPQSIKSHMPEVESKSKDTDIKIQLPRRESVQIITSSATPVITSWTLSNNKILEPLVHKNISCNKDKNDSKPTHVTANIVQIKNPQTQSMQINNIIKPVLTPARVSAPYQVINHLVRPQTSNMQPPTIKIPDPHILYQKPQGIVISPRMANDPRIHSPKPSPQGDTITSPRLSTVPVLTSPQNFMSSGMVSPNSIHQRSPGQVTVVRVQQPPLSPIQAMHLPPGTMTMVSPNRPNSVLVQTQGSPLHHHNRLPVTPILTPIPKQINVSSVLQQNKGVAVNSSPILTQQKIITDGRKTELRHIPENKNENTKIILSPTSLQHSTNPTVMAQNRLISMQNAVHIGNINSPLHLNNKFVINRRSSINEKRDNAHQKGSDHGNTFVTSPNIHVAGVTHSSPSIIQSGNKSVVCNLQETCNMNRGQSSNVIHSLNSQRIITPASLSNVRQLDVTKMSPSVLSMATIRPSTVLTKLVSTTTTATTSNVANVTPILIKSGATIGKLRIHTKPDKEIIQSNVSPVQKENKSDDKIDKDMSSLLESNTSKQTIFALKPLQNSIDGSKLKCETDFEELLKDNTNKIIVAKDPEKKLEMNIGKSTTILTSHIKNNDKSHLASMDCSFPAKEHNVPVLTQSPLEDSVFKRVDDNTRAAVDEVNKNNSPNHTPSINVPSKETSAKGVIDILAINYTNFHKENTNLETLQTEKNIANLPDYLINKTYENVSIDKDETSLGSMKINLDDIRTKNYPENIANQLKGLDENDSWSAKDINIESVIKKVDSLCNDSVDSFQTSPDSKMSENTEDIKPASEPVSVTNEEVHMDHTDTKKINTTSDNVGSANMTTFGNISTNKRGGRTMRGRKTEKNQDKVQTRQIAKTPRGTAARRGRGRAKVDKKIKSVATSNISTMPGDIYDFHEDSGDESSNKTEPRPRLILTIKSPLLGLAGVTATSTLSITQKDQNKFEERRPSREEKSEDFVLPSPNTRKSRRLQEKDVHRSVSDDVGEDGVRTARPAKRKPIRQNAISKLANTPEKALATDTRKSPRGTKRTRDRSISDGSVDSGDGEGRRDEIIRDPKTPRLEEPDNRTASAELPTSVVNPAAAPTTASATTPAVLHSLAAVGSAVHHTTANAAPAELPAQSTATLAILPAPAAATPAVLPAPTAAVPAALSALAATAPSVLPAPASATAPIVLPTPAATILAVLPSSVATAPAVLPAPTATAPATNSPAANSPAATVCAAALPAATVPVAASPAATVPAATVPAVLPISAAAATPLGCANVIKSHVSPVTALPTPHGAMLLRTSLAAASSAAPPAKPSLPPLITPSVTCLAAPPAAPTPITKPPKKMISEINAKLAAVQHRPEQEATRDPSPAAPATGEALAGDARRPGEPVPCAMLPVGATEEAIARVHSPALPHRALLAQRVAPDRATPILISHRGGEREAAGIGVMGGAGARFRTLVAGGGGAASLPRGAHHPPPEPQPLAKALPVAAVGPHHLAHHHHHPGAASRITSVPSISPQGQLALGEGMYPHFSQQHFQMYQQHFRATQHEQRATPSTFTRMDSEGSEAPASPLELRRVTARVPRPAHSPSPLPGDRHIMYAAKCGVSPPPAHGGFAPRLAGALPPGTAGSAPGAPGPPHASQVPHEADSLQMLLRRYPVMWQGLLALKNDSAAVQMHFVGGNPGVASETLARPPDLVTPMLRVAQRMRLEPMQLDQVHRKMKMENEHCILLALPCGRDHMDVLQQSTNLTGGFITYLQRKQAAGIVNIAPPGHHQAMFTVHIFPSCDFANENLNRIAPDLMHRVANIAHLLIVIATV